jgi:hypothetical protein
MLLRVSFRRLPLSLAEENFSFSLEIALQAQAALEMVAHEGETDVLAVFESTSKRRLGLHILFNDALFGHGIVCFDVKPLPPPMSLGLLKLRGVPLSSAAKPLAALFARHLQA